MENKGLIGAIGLIAGLCLMFGWHVKTSDEIINELEMENNRLRMNPAHYAEEPSPKAETLHVTARVPDTIHLPEHFATWAPTR